MSSDEEDVRSKISNMPLGQVLELKSKIGSTNFNEVVFGKHEKDTEVPKNKNSKQTLKKFKRTQFEDEDVAPMEMSSKKPVPFLGSDGLSKRKRKIMQTQVRDPRFDRKCGEYDAAAFRENFDFVFEMKQNEVKELKKQLKDCKDSEERQKLRFVIQRAENQVREHLKQQKIHKQRAEQKEEIDKAINEGKRPYYMKKSDKRMVGLVEKFVDLKNSGKLKKHIEKRRKKSAGLSKKKMNI